MMDERQESLIARYGTFYIRSLVAAEAAVRRGDFSTAKVLRVAGCVQRTLAMRLARMETLDPDPAILLKDALSDFRELDEVLSSLEVPDPETEDVLKQMDLTRQQAEDLLLHGIQSLEAHEVTLDSYVPQILFVCLNCGAINAGDRPQTCPVCGAVGAEFSWFGPFYAETPERLGRLSPAQIIYTLETVPQEIAQLTAAASEETLTHSPSEEEWCVKEIMGHLIEVERLFHKRAAAILERDDVPDITAPGPPWQMHEGKGYERQSINELLAQFDEARMLSLELILDLTPDQWSRRGVLRDAPTSLHDLGIWLANHDIGHCAQIRRLCNK